MEVERETGERPATAEIASMVSPYGHSAPSLHWGLSPYREAWTFTNSSWGRGAPGAGVLPRAGFHQSPQAPEGGHRRVSAENTVLPSTARILPLLPQTLHNPGPSFAK